MQGGGTHTPLNLGRGRLHTATKQQATRSPGFDRHIGLRPSGDGDGDGDGGEEERKDHTGRRGKWCNGRVMGAAR